MTQLSASQFKILQGLATGGNFYISASEIVDMRELHRLKYVKLWEVSVGARLAAITKSGLEHLESVTSPPRTGNQDADKLQAQVNSLLVEKALLQQKLRQVKTVLQWYECEAEGAANAINVTNSNDKPNPVAATAVLTVLALDGGKRALDMITKINESIKSEQWKHVKRGSIVGEIGIATAQAATRPIEEGDEVRVYFHVDDGKWWVRRVEEFDDGRFEKLNDE